jgi:Arc/MetJ-type ribon-helix-helix transcriptional regulator
VGHAGIWLNQAQFETISDKLFERFAMNISLSPELERLIAEKISSGQYRTADEVIREGLELLRERDNGPQRYSPNGASDFALAFENISSNVPDEDWEGLPPDLSKNVDHYLYGARKIS